MNLVQRVQDILLRPKTTWPQIEGEAATPASLYKEYVGPLALIPAVAGFIGTSIVGFSVMGMPVRVPIVSGLLSAVVSFVLSLAMVYVLALIIDALAPSFEGRRDPIAALKVAAYAATPGFVGGVFMLLPLLGILALLAGLYAIYLLYLGLPALMKCPPGKAVVYTAVVTVCGIVASLLIGAATSLFTPAPAGRVGWLQPASGLLA